ncbi:hypothetical protein NDU88_011088 [Pleurodeles waltl]|uniref:Uncharacterized protein n=1 Tax=Pleurodeles waltl TaxID=8319 RepID=A0AAV7S540_PLEWA|nr:hypothetical protein NDU88_011088 [Pleurodeles waltl]
MASSLLRDHEYGDQPLQEIPESFPKLTKHSQETAFSSSAFSDSEKLDQGSQKDSLPPSKKKRNSDYLSSDLPGSSVHNLLLDPENIIHLRSMEWVPSVEVAHYVQERLRKGFEKDVCSTLRSECPRPSLLGKVADTPELDPSMTTFLKKIAKDPKKGMDRA